MDVLSDKEGAWGQVVHVLSTSKCNLEKINKMLKITQSKKIETTGKSICHKKDSNCQKKGKARQFKKQESAEKRSHL